MAKGSRFGGFKRVSGAHIGKLAIKVYVCNGCMSHYRINQPPQCLRCGRMDFVRMDSVAEANRWSSLNLLERAGDIKGLQRQIPFDLCCMDLNGDKHKVATYKCDFVYEERQKDGSWKWVIEDVKGSAIDPIARMKLKWMEKQGMPVRLTS